MNSIHVRNLSHLVIASSQVSRMTEFIQEAFCVQPHYANDEFADFVLSSGTRIAFFKPTGKSAKFFNSDTSRGCVAFGITVDNVHDFYRHCVTLSEKFSLTFSGPPKDHPWGEPSFLLIDPDGNRWEITQSPSPEGLLVHRDFKD